MSNSRPAKLSLTLLTLFGAVAEAEIDRIWLTHGKSSPETMMINWESNGVGASVVEYGETAALGKRAATDDATQLHHVEVPLGKAGLHYRVMTGSEVSPTYFTRGYGDEELRVVVVGDVGFAKADWAAAVLKVKPDLVLAAGDHVPALHSGAPVAAGTTTAFGLLVKRWPELFRTTRIMPVLGNHDREIRPRGPRPPPEPVYDVEAAAFRTFFALPDEEWRWHFDVPQFGVRFVGLDLNHLGDLGTTWQTCHSPAKDGPQFGWYRNLMAQSRQPFVVTIHNERNGTVRGLEKGEWARMIEQGLDGGDGFWLLRRVRGSEWLPLLQHIGARHRR
jgi:hypothetical protein